MSRRTLMRFTPAIRRFHQNRPLCNGGYSHLKLTFFGKPNCGLCDEAKEVIDDVLTENKDYSIAKEKMKFININKDQKWWNEYCFDIPVLHIEDENKPDSLVKIMHFFKEDELNEILQKFKK